MHCTQSNEHALYTFRSTCIVHIPINIHCTHSDNMHCAHSYQHALYTFSSTCIVNIVINMHCTHSYQLALYTFSSTCIVHIFTTSNFVTPSFVRSLIHSHCQFQPHFQTQRALNKSSFSFFFLIINACVFSVSDQSSPRTV